MYQLEKLKFLTGVVHGFSERKEGNMSLKWAENPADTFENRRDFLNKIGVSATDCVTISLAHGEDIWKVEGKDRGRGMSRGEPVVADAMITNEKNIYFFMLIADCLPIILYEKDKQIIALLHLGVKNSQSQLIEKTMKKIGEFGGRPENLFVGIGPAIHKESYIYEYVDNSRELNIPAWGKFIRKLKGKAIAIDMIGYNREKLIRYGVPIKNIEISPFDTASGNKFFSHHREIKKGRKEGRFAAVVGMTD
jgi:hypothetical protein